MRNFIRHPSDIPIDFQLEELVFDATDYLKNVSHGGLAFHSRRAIPVNSIIRIKIPLIDPVFQTIGRVSWCHPEQDFFEVGVEFLGEDDAFRARMIEQICHIEHYKQSVMENEGRKLTGEEAAIEWIRKFAKTFPQGRETKK